MSDNTYSARSIALALGMGETQATLSIEQMGRRPLLSDPDAASTVLITKAVQRGLNQMGCGLKESGRINNAMASCMAVLCGPSWRNKTWTRIGRDILRAQESGRKLPRGLGVGHDGLGSLAMVKIGTPRTSSSPGKVFTGGTGMSEVKANWPRCNMTVRDSRTGVTSQRQGFLYTFVDGRTVCTFSWNQDLYLKVVQGEALPMAELDLSQVEPGSEAYFRWLCKAQNNPEVRAALDRAGIKWHVNMVDPKHTVKSLQRCTLYVKNSDSKNPTKATWRRRAYQYAAQEKKRDGGEGPIPREHRASRCKDLVPPDLVYACEDALSKGDGASIDSFLEEVEEARKSAADAEGAGAQALKEARDAQRAARSSRSGVPTVLIAGGVVGVVLAAALLKKKRKR